LRILFATLLGFAGFLAYVAGVVVLADEVTQAHWLVQLAFFIAAGVLWAFPARWLMFWAVGQR
jgi:hypothetical protein